MDEMLALTLVTFFLCAVTLKGSGNKWKFDITQEEFKGATVTGDFGFKNSVMEITR